MTETFSNEAQNEQMTPGSTPEALTLNERVEAKVRTQQAKFSLVENIQNQQINAASNNLQLAQPLQTPHEVDSLPKPLRDNFSEIFKNLEKGRVQGSKDFEKAKTQWDRDRAIGRQYYDIQVAAKEAQNPAFQKAYPEEAMAINARLAEQSSLFPSTMYGPVHKGPNDAIKSQVSTAARLGLMAIAGTYTVMAAVAGWKSKNLFPAMAGAVVTAVAIFGIDGIFGGKGKQLLKQMEVMIDPEFDKFMDRYDMRGSERWATYIEGLQQSKKVSVLALKNIKELEKKKDESDADLATRKYNAAMALLGNPTDPTIRGHVKAMLSNSDPSDLNRLVHLAEGSDDLKKAKAAYIRKGGNSECLRAAQHPEMFGESPVSVQQVEAVPAQEVTGQPVAVPSTPQSIPQAMPSGDK